MLKMMQGSFMDMDWDLEIEFLMGELYSQMFGKQRNMNCWNINVFLKIFVI